jgi:hypothetical protein
MSMSELDWPEGRDLQPLLISLYGKVRPRKLRLCAVAFCRRIAHLLPNENSRRGIEVAERYADRLATRQELASAHADAESACRAIEWVIPTYGVATSRSYATQALLWTTRPTKRQYADRVADRAAAAVASAALAHEMPRPVLGTQTYYDRWTTAHAGECSAQLRLLRDILGNSLRPPCIAPEWLAWNGGTVTRLAAAVYDERAFDRLPVLADALEDAGCADQEVLSHLRGPGPHVRGCWALDLLLGKQ